MSGRRTRIKLRPSNAFIVASSFVGTCVAVLGGLGYLIHSDMNDSEVLENKTRIENNDSGLRYRLHNGHSVRLEYGGTQNTETYIYNFDREILAYGVYGETSDILPFNALSNPGQVEEVREQGCALATEVIPALNESSTLFYEEERENALEFARVFARHYCP